MKRLLPLVACLFALPVLAGDVKKDPEVQARENLKMAKSMMDEAKFMEKAALQLEGAEAKTVSEYAKVTAEEAEWLAKSSEAYSKNQIRLAERFQRKASECCEQRGKMLGKIDALRPKMKGEACEEKPATSADQLAEIERKQAELEQEKKALLEKKTN